MGTLWMGLALSQTTVIPDKALRQAFTSLKSMRLSCWRRVMPFDLLQKSGFSSETLFILNRLLHHSLWYFRWWQLGRLFRYTDTVLKDCFYTYDLTFTWLSFVKADSTSWWNDRSSTLLYKKSQTHNHSILSCKSFASLISVAISL